MTVYPGPHNARSVVRDLRGLAQAAAAIAQTLALCAMSPSGGVKLTNADVSSQPTCNGFHVCPPPVWQAQVAVLRLERALAGRLICLHQHSDYPHVPHACPAFKQPCPDTEGPAGSARGFFRASALSLGEVNVTR